MVCVTYNCGMAVVTNRFFFVFNGGKRKVYQDHYKMDVGLTLRDFRSTARICNIDVSNLAGGSGVTPDNLLDLMTKAYYKIKKHNMGGKTVIVYANDSVLTSTVKSWVSEGMSMAESNAVGRSVKMSADIIPAEMARRQSRGMW